MNEKIEILRKAFKDLGYKSGKVKFKMFYGHAIVELNGKYFGRYDFNRNTFVDWNGVTEWAKKDEKLLKRNHKSIKAATPQKILRRQYDLLAEYSRTSSGTERLTELSKTMLEIYRELCKGK